MANEQRVNPIPKTRKEAYGWAVFRWADKLNIYLVDGCDPALGLKVFKETIGELKKPPLITVLKQRKAVGFFLPLLLTTLETRLSSLPFYPE